jgi:hypothetical protein
MLAVCSLSPEERGCQPGERVSAEERGQGVSQGRWGVSANERVGCQSGRRGVKSGKQHQLLQSGCRLHR